MTHEEDDALRNMLAGLDTSDVEGDGAGGKPRTLVVAMRPLSAPNPHKEMTPCPFLRHVWQITSESTTRDLTLYCAKCGWSYPEVAEDAEAKHRCTFATCEKQRTAGTAFCEAHQ